MGWASGSMLAEKVWKLFRKYVSEEERTIVAKQLIKAFQQEDWDTVEEAECLATDAEWFDEDEEDEL